MTARRFRPSWIGLLATLVVAAVCLQAAFWQLSRAEEKRTLASDLATRIQQGYQSMASLAVKADPHNYPLEVRGRFDNRHNILLDNRMLDGIAGYHLLTPLHTDEGDWLLVNRGWLPRGRDRALLPEIPAIDGHVTVQGQSYVYSPRTFVLAEDDLTDPSWPLRLQKVEMDVLSPLLGVELAPFELRVAPGATLEQGEQLPRVWHDPVMGPERHHAYAVQWFAMAAAVVIFFVAISFRRRETDNPHIDA
ncbi:SURF1 family protein [Isoalcanivorax indicus]|uniref:SURF1 family protein n=1 Tax=Isoalcanivorax indicus TaxID=2202653 RepID=UPI000DB91CAA|nr:SURF1 family protein [Isoalcanivorax indicus]